MKNRFKATLILLSSLNAALASDPTHQQRTNDPYQIQQLMQECAQRDRYWTIQYKFMNLPIEELRKFKEHTLKDTDLQAFIRLLMVSNNLSAFPDLVTQLIDEGEKDGATATAQFRLARMYRGGQGIPENMGKAVEYYRRAAEQGHGSASLNLGNAYEYGKGVPKDLGKAEYWFRKAMEQDLIGARTYLGHLLLGRGEIKKARKLFKFDAKKDFPPALCELGNSYTAESKYKKAFGYYKQAAEQGQHHAQFELACLYFAGNGVKQDKQQALHWLKEAANSGNRSAQSVLAQLPEEMKDIPQQGHSCRHQTTNEKNPDIGMQ